MTAPRIAPKKTKAPSFPNDGLVTITEALTFLRIGRTHFYSLIKQRKVQEPVKLGGARRWPAKHIRAVAGVK